MTGASAQSKNVSPLKKTTTLTAIAAAKNGDASVSVKTTTNNGETPHEILREHVLNQRSFLEPPNAVHNLTVYEQSALLEWINHNEFCGRTANKNQIEAMANLLLKARGVRPAEKVSLKWASNFIKNRHDLTNKFQKTINIKRTTCEDPKILANWFDCVRNVLERYNIVSEDIFHFDEAAYFMGLGAEAEPSVRHDSSNQLAHLLPQTRESVAIIECTNASGWTLAPFVVFKGQTKVPKRCSLAHETLFIDAWVEGWTNDKLARSWLEKLFIPSTKARMIGEYRLLILNGHESYLTPQFDSICTDNKIIVMCMPALPSNRVRLDAGCFGALKQTLRDIAGKIIGLNEGIVTKSWFVEMYPQVRAKAFEQRKVRASYAAAGLVPFDPAGVFSKFKDKVPPTLLPNQEVSPGEQMPCSFEEPTPYNVAEQVFEKQTPSILNGPTPSFLKKQSFQKETTCNFEKQTPCTVEEPAFKTKIPCTVKKPTPHNVEQQAFEKPTPPNAEEQAFVKPTPHIIEKPTVPNVAERVPRNFAELAASQQQVQHILKPILHHLSSREERLVNIFFEVCEKLIPRLILPEKHLSTALIKRKQDESGSEGGKRISLTGPQTSHNAFLQLPENSATAKRQTRDILSKDANSQTQILKSQARSQLKDIHPKQTISSNPSRRAPKTCSVCKEQGHAKNHCQKRQPHPHSGKAIPSDLYQCPPQCLAHGFNQVQKLPLNMQPLEQQLRSIGTSSRPAVQPTQKTQIHSKEEQQYKYQEYKKMLGGAHQLSSQKRFQQQQPQHDDQQHYEQQYYEQKLYEQRQYEQQQYWNQQYQQQQYNECRDKQYYRHQQMLEELKKIRRLSQR